MSDMKDIKLYRRRYIPNEKIFLKDDIILYADQHKIITKWKPFKTRKDFCSGISAAYIKDGYKISQMFDQNGDTVYYYCDIIETVFDEESNSYTFNDLLADVKVYPDGKVEVIDLDELAEAYEKEFITSKQIKNCLRQLNKLLGIVYNGNIKSLLPESF